MQSYNWEQQRVHMWMHAIYELNRGHSGWIFSGDCSKLVWFYLLERKYFTHHDVWHRRDANANAELHNEKHCECEIAVIANVLVNTFYCRFRMHIEWRPAGREVFESIGSWSRIYQNWAWARYSNFLIETNPSRSSCKLRRTTSTNRFSSFRMVAQWTGGQCSPGYRANPTQLLPNSDRRECRGHAEFERYTAAWQTCHWIAWSGTERLSRGTVWAFVSVEYLAVSRQTSATDGHTSQRAFRRRHTRRTVGCNVRGFWIRSQQPQAIPSHEAIATISVLLLCAIWIKAK